ncbi:MAG: hypothetical protein KAJ08_00965 [Deltaproteobacteria bacterium]|nr:hypothetical protein [Deltaproteobacteria bacterium]
MVKYITFCEMTPEFLKLQLEERQQFVKSWGRIASDFGIKIVFWGMPIGVREHVVCVFEANGNEEKFFKFQREWLALGTKDAGKYIRNTRSIPVY